MNPLFLLKLIADFLKDDKPSIEQVKCARTIIENLIEYHDPIKNMEESDVENLRLLNSGLSPEAQQAKKELQ